MYDPFRESREERLTREAKENKEAKEQAEQQLQISQLAFVFGDIRIDILTAFKSAQTAFIYDEVDEDSYYSEIDLNTEMIMNDISASTFKVGEKLTCRVREATKEGKKEIWLQYKFNKTFVNLYDPDRYFFREVDGVSMFIFVKPDGVGIILTSIEKITYEQARKHLLKVSKSIISYDRNGYTVIKKTARNIA